MKYLSLVYLSAAFFFLFIGCKSGAKLDQPPEMHYGKDPCDECGMIINEARFAAAYVTPDGVARRFDDIGCLLRHHQKQPENVANFWVNDYDAGEWLNADNAYFVESDSILTPMGYGIIAVGIQSRAEELINEFQSGSIKGFDNLSK